MGCSDKYHARLGFPTRLPVADGGSGIAEKPISWIPSPVLYILMHEPPARPYYAAGSKKWFFHWHYTRGPTDVPFEQLQRDGQKFISPVLFVDGHAAKHDFTAALRSDPTYHFEPTKDWVWTIKDISQVSNNSTPPGLMECLHS